MDSARNIADTAVSVCLLAAIVAVPVLVVMAVGLAVFSFPPAVVGVLCRAMVVIAGFFLACYVVYLVSDFMS